MKTPVHYAFNQSDDDLVKSFADASLSSNSHSLMGQNTLTSSSSRRGSLSRKSPSVMFESNALMECSHMIKRRLSNQSNSSINFELSGSRMAKVSNENLYYSGSSENLVTRASEICKIDSPSSGYDTQKVMTSFEQLATLR